MAKVHAYLNFNGDCNQAFDFYQKVFNSERLGTYFYDDIPAEPNQPPLPEDAKGKVMHTAVKINNETMLMGSDVVEGFGHALTNGNSTYIMLDVESPEEAKQYYDALSEGARVMEMELGETFFAELYSSFQDKFGINWMIHFEGNKKMG
ncbi:VOC family protein [Sphingobacterium daejeonense]|uniref:VOC family protein n=1 Tax=Sphingobacterium daejeonense TaxID=371142 RepID=UPI0010C47B54|nr:VOC family protein [Sphingobacterium daejeonense]VTP97085.1 3-demethylubiquinone-9 3-methyltransferase [Sphingobacterium daejeonense]